MNSNTSVFIQQSSNFQFLSVCHYINIFGLYFYNKNLITFEKQSDTIFILNTLFEYLNKSKNESKAKLQLLRKVLKGSDLYGGGENETLDMKYVDETYQYIISKALFSHYGNINGYLAKIINVADNLNYLALREKVFRHFLKNYESREFCFNNYSTKTYNNSLGIDFNNISPKNYSSKFSILTIKQIFYNYIWSIFPEPEQDTNIMEVNYIYAMVGLKIVRSLSDVSNLTFQEYILIAREIDLHDYHNETYEMILKLFSTSALFFYAHNKKEKFQKIDSNLTNEFWIEAYENLFTHITFTMRRIVREELKTSLHYQLEKKINLLKSRTFIASEILHLYCNYENYMKVPHIYVAIYKTLYLWITKLLLPNDCHSDLPDLEKIYYDQFLNVEEIYNKIERNAIEKVLIDSKIIENYTEVSIMLARVPDYRMHCMYCAPIPRMINTNIYLLFAVKKNEEINFYAFKQENNTLSLLRNRGNEQEFAKAVANDSSLKMEIAVFAKNLKYYNEDREVFIKRVADIKTALFLNKLKMYYYDETLGEKFLNFVKSLIPFYSCIENIKGDNLIAAGFSCTMDIFTLIPIIAFAAKYTTTVSNLIVEIGEKYLITNSLLRAVNIKLPLVTTFRQISQMIVQSVAKEILTKQMLKDLTIASLRTIDPGFELSYQITRFGFHVFRKVFRNMITNFRNIPFLQNTLVFVKSLMRNLKLKMRLISDDSGLVPVILAKSNDYEIVRYLYPGGSHFFGPTCLKSLGNTAELRSIEGYSFTLPVVREKSGFYKQYNPKTGGTIDNLKMNSNDVLQRVGNLINEMIINGRDVNIIHNYHVYHNRINWNPPAEVNPNRETIQNSVNEFQEEGTSNNEGDNFDQSETSKETKSNFDLYSMTLKDLLNTGEKPPPSVKTLSDFAESPPPVNWKIKNSNSDVKNNLKTSANKRKLEEPTSGEGKKFLITEVKIISQPSTFVTILNPKFYQTLLKEPIYLKYVEILFDWQKNGLSTLKIEGKINFLRTAINKLTLLHLEQSFPMEIPKKLWYTQTIKGRNNIDFMKNLKGKSFFFNDITLLKNKPPGPLEFNNWHQFHSEFEVRYHIKILSSNGFLDLSNFHDEFKNNYITFNDVLFTVKDTFFTANNKVLNIELVNQEISIDLWKRHRKLDMKNLLIGDITKTERMKAIDNAADLITENTPLCTFTSVKKFLSNYILAIKLNNDNFVPTYKMFAEDVNSMMYHYSYTNWKIENNPHIQDVLINYNLDETIELKEAKRRIDDVYDEIYFENIEITFENYQKIPNVNRYFRFEDYYVLHSLINNKFVMNKNGIRRFEVAINRLGIRQCDEELIKKPITLYRGELITKEMSEKLIESLRKDNIVAFDKFKKFSPHRDIVLVNCLNQIDSPSFVSLIIEVTLNNRAGVTDVSQFLKDNHLVHIVTSDFEFVFDDWSHSKILNEDILIMRMHDNTKISTEKRMIQMSKKLHELFSTDTKFYSDVIEISD
ncbi:uncharacterized protein LOC127277455 [Leptopilina boulardi]|uniref:uncharacterized protein LOC127277455 n=1 Tax=Leptopilina boulardi TaxID=63433 RepID=UPI0021F62718|nr:uncharacterized protein LOC127277455 [Leptopilina boulardi]